MLAPIIYCTDLVQTLILGFTDLETIKPLVFVMKIVGGGVLCLWDSGVEMVSVPINE